MNLSTQTQAEPAQIRQEIDGLRHYGTSDGVFPSVTAILSATEKPEALQRLADWKARTPNHESYAKRGTLVHDVCRRYLLAKHTNNTPWGNGEYPAAALLDSKGNPLSPEEARFCLNDLEPAKQFVRGTREILECFSDFVWIEGPVRPEDSHTVGSDGIPRLWSKQYGFAGAPDLIAKYINDDYVLVDIKTSEKPYRKFRPSAKHGTDEFRVEYGGWMKFKKAAIQIAAYRIMARETLGIDISQGMVLVALPHVSNTYSLDVKTLDYYEKLWLEKVEQYYSAIQPPNEVSN
jgi:PD-(D/E)XK nuclease superfamily